MALDEALMARATDTGDWLLRVYTWSRPTVSLGRNQTARGRYDLDTIRLRGIDVVRRPTGGRAILHDREITYSVTAPVADAGDLRESYERINRLLLAALQSLGVNATVATATKRPGAPGMAPCFDEPSAGELVVGDRKLAGSAQWRSDGALLQQGSILLADDQRLLAELTTEPARVIPSPATLTDLLGHAPTAADAMEALTNAVRSLEDPAATPIDIDAKMRARAEGLVVPYSDDAWTWRR
jgi:lipoate-protein ligase A